MFTLGVIKIVIVLMAAMIIAVKVAAINIDNDVTLPFAPAFFHMIVSMLVLIIADCCCEMM